MANADDQTPRPGINPGIQKRPKATISSRYLIPLATAMLLGVCFVIYYLTYVQQHREYLLNRNYRVLATLGEQMSETLANQTATLTSYVNAFEGNEFADTMHTGGTFIRARGKNDKKDEKADKLLSEGGDYGMSEEIHTFAPRLSHVKVRAVAARQQDPAKYEQRCPVANEASAGKSHPPPQDPELIRRDGQWMFLLAAVDDCEDHEASSTISVEDLARSFSPSILDTFDDVLIADEESRIIYQKQRIGPHFSRLSELVKGASQLLDSGRQPGEKDKSKTETSAAGGSGSEQLVETDLAGVPTLIFLEPVTIDLNPSRGAEKKYARRFTLCGLVPSRGFRWQSLAISYRAVILLFSVFLLLCLCTPIIKIFFLNERERLRLREIVVLPLLFAAVAGAGTAICLQMFYFGLGRDDTDRELNNVARQMQDNIKAEVTAMYAQLMAACDNDYLISDLAFHDKQDPPQQVIRNNVLGAEFLGAKPARAPYPYFGSFFVTDDKGRQIVKWSTASEATPLIDVSSLEFFRHLDYENHYFFLDGMRPFRLDSLLPPNQDNYVGVMGMRISDCVDPQRYKSAGFVFLSAQLLSLIDPKMPLGISFAVVDETGRVLFHSDKYRNNRENILVETRNDPELTASLYGHSNQQSFSLSYRGNDVRARVVSVPGITQSPWSLIVYKDVLYAQTYDLEIITMAGTLLAAYLGIPALIAYLFYIFARPVYVPDWMWPSRSAADIYRYHIVAGLCMLALSAALIFWRPVEESLYAAPAAGYLTAIIVLWSTLSRHFPTRAGTVHWICGLTGLVIAVFPVLPRWWIVLAALLSATAAVVLLRYRNFTFEPGFLRDRHYRFLYNLRALVLLTVVAILPPLSFFLNSMRVEDFLHIRVAQLHAASAWNSRERMIEQLNKEVPRTSEFLVGPGLTESRFVGPPAVVDRCRTVWDFYLSSYFGTEANRQTHSLPQSSTYLDDGFLRFVHSLHHSYNDIGAEALGVLRNPGMSESVYVPESPSRAPESPPSPESITNHILRFARLSHSSDNSTRTAPDAPAPAKRPESRLVADPAEAGSPEWQWVWVDGAPKPLQLRLHEGTDLANTCAAPDPANAAPAQSKRDLVISSLPPLSRVSALANIITWLLVVTVIGFLFRMITRKVFLLDLREPLSYSPEKLGELLKNAGYVLVLPASRDDWSPDLAGSGAARIDLRKLAAEGDWGEKFDLTGVDPEGGAVVENFDWELNSPITNRQRLILMERLVVHSGKVVAVSAVDPSPFMIDHCGSDAEFDADRWATVLQAFTQINLGRRPSWAAGAEIAEKAPSLWRECRVKPELHRVGEELWSSLRQAHPIEREQLVAEVGQRAAHYYHLEWRACTQEECFLLTGLAADGMMNPRNTTSLRQLMRRRLIVRNPQFRIMNESFRRFVLAQAGISMREVWEAEAAGSGWGKARVPFATGLVLVGLFLLATQQQFLQTSTGILTAAGVFAAAVLKLIGVVQGRGTGE